MYVLGVMTSDKERVDRSRRKGKDLNEGMCGQIEWERKRLR